MLLRGLYKGSSCIGIFDSPHVKVKGFANTKRARSLPMLGFFATATFQDKMFATLPIWLFFNCGLVAPATTLIRLGIRLQKIFGGL